MTLQVLKHFRYFLFSGRHGRLWRRETSIDTRVRGGQEEVVVQRGRVGHAPFQSHELREGGHAQQQKVQHQGQCGLRRTELWRGGGERIQGIQEQFRRLRGQL